MTHVEQHPTTCVFCGNDGLDFLRHCDGVCLPCGDKLQSLGLMVTQKRSTLAATLISRLDATEPLSESARGALEAAVNELTGGK